MTTLKMIRNKKGEYTKKSKEINEPSDSVEYLTLKNVVGILRLRKSVARLSIALWAVVIGLVIVSYAHYELVNQLVEIINTVK